MSSHPRARRVSIAVFVGSLVLGSACAGRWHVPRRCPAATGEGRVRNAQGRDGEWPFPIYTLVVDGVKQEVAISDADIAAIVEALAHEPSEDIQCKAIVSILVEDRNSVEVDTGVVRGPLDGAGDSIRFVRDGDAWRIEGVSRWVS